MAGPGTALEEALKAALKGAKGAKVVRPAEKELAAQEAEAAAKKAAQAGGPPAGERTVRPSEPKTRVKPAAPEVTPPPVPEPTPGVAAPAAPKVEPVAPKAAPAARTIDDLVPPTPVDMAATEEAAARISRVNLGDYALDATHMPNFDVITKGDDIKATIAELAESNRANIEAARGPAVLKEQLQGLANDIGVSQEAVFNTLTRERGGALDQATIVGTRQFINASADRIKELGTKIADGMATDFDKVAFARQIQLHNAVNAQFMAARADWGRAGHAFGLPVGGDATQLARINDLLTGSGMNIEKLAQAVKLANSVSGVSKIVKQSLFKRSAGASVNLFVRNMINGILSGPTTHAVNMGGNTLFGVMNVAETAVAAQMGRFLTGSEHVLAGEATAMLHGLAGATADAFRLAARALRKGETLDRSVKFGTTGTSDTLARLPELDRPYLGQVVHGVDTFIGLPTRALGAEDEFFKTLAYRSSLERQGFIDISNRIRSNTLSIDDAPAAMREFMENPTAEAEQIAEDWAREMTFQSPLGEFGKSVQSLQRFPPFQVIAPFIQTPVNIFKQAAYRSPVALMAPKFYAEVAAGGARRDLALTRLAMGTSTALMIAYWTLNDEITGAGPSDPAARMLWMANGKRPYSVRVKGPDGNYSWVSYARMEPVASVVGSVADSVEIGSYLDHDVESLTPDQNQQAYQAAGAIIAGIMNNTGNKTFMKGIADFAEFVNDPTQQLKSYASSMAAAQIPYSGLLRTVRNLDDPYLREAWTIQDKMRDTLPGFSSDLPLRLGLFGEPREKNSGSLLGTMSPIPESPEKYDYVTKELVRVMHETNKVPVTMPGKNVEGLRLLPKEYETLIKIARTQPLFDGTTTFHDKLDEVINSEQYQRMTPIGQFELLRHFQSIFDEAGQVQLEQQDPGFARRIAEWRIRKARLKGGATE